MARILYLGVALAAFSTLPPSPAHGFWWGCTDQSCGEACGQNGCGQQETLCEHCKQIYHMNQRWPSPYVCPDRASVRAPFDTMVSNGWRRQNLMGPHHFNEDCTKLTQAGELKVQWIMTQAPAVYRQMYIERSVDPDVTAKRMATVRDYSTVVAMNQSIPEVSETHIVSEGRPAAAVDFVNTRFRDNQRVPMLPASSGPEQQ
jgi:hypothetical protein